MMVIAGIFLILMVLVTSFLYNRRFFLLAGIVAFLVGALGLSLSPRGTFLIIQLYVYMLGGIGLISYSIYNNFLKLKDKFPSIDVPFSDHAETKKTIKHYIDGQ